MRSRGFTVVEMTIVVGMIALLATIVVPRAFAIRDAGLTRETEAKLVAGVRTARALARSRGERLVVGLDADTGYVTIAAASEGAEDRFETNLRVPGRFTVGSVSRTESRGAESRASAGETLGVFFEDGTAEPVTAELTIGERNRTLRVEANGTIEIGGDLEPAAPAGPATPGAPVERWPAGDLENRA